jgi:hypothetical protein
LDSSSYEKKVPINAEINIHSQNNISYVYPSIDKPEQVPHTHHNLSFCLNMIPVQTGSTAGQHYIMWGPGNCGLKGTYFN